MQPGPCDVRKLRAGDIEQTSDVLARAFSDNACYLWMHAHARRGSQSLRAFFRRNLEWHLCLNLTWVACLASGDVVGTVTLEPPHGVPGTLLQGLRHWVLPTWRDEGFETVRRIVLADGEFKKHYRGIGGGDAYWHVHAVAVDPEGQGRGVGRAMMATALHALTELRHRQPAPVLLSTQRERNIAFYTNLGFELTHEATLGRNREKRGYRSWFMRHRELSRPSSSAA